MRPFNKLLIFSILIISITFCKRETSWDIDAAFPIAKSSLNINNIFGDTIFKSDASGLIHIAYSRELINFTIDSLVKLPDTTIILNYAFPVQVPLTPGMTLLTNVSFPDKEIKFNVSNGVELNKVILKKGFLKVDYKNSCRQPLKFKYQINSATLLGNILEINQVISDNSSISKSYPLDGYTLNLTGTNGNKINTLLQTYTISADASGLPDVLQPGEGIDVTLSYIDIVPEYVQGYFGQQNLSFGPDSTDIGGLGNFNPTNLVLTQSSVNFRIVNEFGVEMSSSINTMASIKSTPYNKVILNAGNILRSINVNRASKTNNPTNPVTPWKKQINVNSTNSNLNLFLQNLPNYLVYSVDAKLNPLGNSSSGNDFAYYGKGLKVYADIDIPLSLSADYFTLINYAQVDLVKLNALKNVNSCELHLDSKNNYPFEAHIQGYMMNEQNIIIDSLFIPKQNIIPAGITNANNIVINPVNSRLVSYLDKNKVENLRKCKQIKFMSYLYLSNQPTPVTISESGYLDLELSTFLNYNSKIK